jgi:hypothetical protein
MCAYCLYSAVNDVVLLAAILLKIKKGTVKHHFVVTLYRHAWRCHEPFGYIRFIFETMTLNKRIVLLQDVNGFDLVRLQ